MNTDQLLYLIDIARTGSMTATAANYYCTQQAVSESVKRLERELDCTILERKNKGVEFTDAGKLVLYYATQQINQLGRLKRDIAQFRDTAAIQGTLQVGCAPMAASVIMPRLYMELSTSYPGIRPIMQENTVEVLLQHLDQGNLDIVMLNDHEDEYFTEFRKKHAEDMFFQKLYADELVCVMSPQNPLAKQTLLSVHDLNASPQTMYYTHVAAIPDDIVIHVSNQTEIHQYFMRHRDTITLIPYHSYKELYKPKGFIYRPLADFPPLTSYLVCPVTHDEEKERLYRAFIYSVLKASSTFNPLDYSAD